MVCLEFSCRLGFGYGYLQSTIHFSYTFSTEQDPVIVSLESDYECS